ncbi:MAG: hypothetical protein MUE82_06720, partial [Chloroflexi bacterium]|nr:hypothetical protein [Chloroflexota bacterium]
SWEVQDPALPSRGLAAAILATPAGQTLARQAAIGAAVERLPMGVWSIEFVPTTDDLSAWEYVYTRPDGDVFTGPTLPDAIAAALGDEP